MNLQRVWLALADETLIEVEGLTVPRLGNGWRWKARTTSRAGGVMIEFFSVPEAGEVVSVPLGGMPFGETP